MRKDTVFGWNQECLLKNNAGWIPVMGEFHYSRYEESDWRHELELMKAGGIEIVATYVIWLHHEEEEGTFSWDGNRNLRKFVELAAECGLYVWLRIGPWIHGEVRNGGFPDWMLKKAFSTRSNAPGYLQEVGKFYDKIGQEVKGLFMSEGGPILGIQLENEYHGDGHMDMKQQNEHIRNLYELSQRAGLITPYVTVTGWGNAGTGRDTKEGKALFLPVYGGYCEAPWDARTTELEANINYVFSPQRDDGNIGKDLFDAKASLSLAVAAETEKGEVTGSLEKTPYLLAELGGGVQVTMHRRPRITGRDIESMMMVKIGNGANLVGFYMYHGGINPIGKRSTFQESKATGYPNDLPVRNYDFMAPMGACGELRESYRRIRRFSIFLQQYGERLSGMKTYFPEGSTENPNDLDTLRYVVRRNGDSGFLFINRYQRKRIFSEWNGKIEIPLEHQSIEFPINRIKNGAYGMYPFNIEIGSNTIESANVSLLCTLHGHGEEIPVFFGTEEPDVRWKEQHKPEKILFLTEEESINACKIKLQEKEYLVFAYGVLYQHELHWHYRAEKEIGNLFIYPPIEDTGAYLKKMEPEKENMHYAGIPGAKKGAAGYELMQQESGEPEVTVTGISGDDTLVRRIFDGQKAGGVTGEPAGHSEAWKYYQLQIHYKNKKQRTWLTIHYRGNLAEIYDGDTLLADDFYHGMEWRVSLHQNQYPEKLTLRIRKLDASDNIFFDDNPFVEHSSVTPFGQLEDVQGHTEYEWRVW